MSFKSDARMNTVKKISDFLIRFWKVIAWCVVIFYMSSIPLLPKVGIIWWDFILKKSAHVFEYFILYLLAYTSISDKKNWRTPLFFCLAYALSDEYHQTFVYGRTAKFMDVGFDSLGMLLALSRYFNLKKLPKIQ